MRSVIREQHQLPTIRQHFHDREKLHKENVFLYERARATLITLVGGIFEKESCVFRECMKVMRHFLNTQRHNGQLKPVYQDPIAIWYDLFFIYRKFFLAMLISHVSGDNLTWNKWVKINKSVRKKIDSKESIDYSKSRYIELILLDGLKNVYLDFKYIPFIHMILQGRGFTEYIESTVTTLLPTFRCINVRSTRSEHHTTLPYYIWHAEYGLHVRYDLVYKDFIDDHQNKILRYE